MLKRKHFDLVFEQLQDHKAVKDLCDVSLISEGKQYPCHRILLSSSSEYFRKLFTSDMKERNEDQIEIKGVSSIGLTSCLHFIYSGEAIVNNKNVGEILHAACLFQLWLLKEACFDFLKAYLAPKSSLEVYQLSRLYENRELENSSLCLILENAELLFNEMISLIDFDTFKMMLISDILNVSSEFTTFEALQKWIKEDATARNVYFCDLFKLVRLPVMPKTYIAKTVMRNQHVVKTCSKCRSYLHRTLSYHITNEQEEIEDFQMKPRLNKSLSHSNSKVIYFNNHWKNPKEFCFKKCTFNDVKIHDPPIVPSLYCTVYFDDKIYLTGNKDCNKVFSICLKNTKCWKKLQAMLSLHGAVCNTCVYKNKILVVGGDTGGFYSRKVEAFDIEKKLWLPLPDLKIARCNMAIAVLSDFVYVIGGLNSENLSSVERYSLGDTTWTEIASLNIKRRGCVAANFRNNIFVMGGYNGDYLSSVEMLNAASNVWINVTETKFKRRNCGACIKDDKLIVFGGENENDKSMFEVFGGSEWTQSKTPELKNEWCKVFTYS